MVNQRKGYRDLAWADRDYCLHICVCVCIHTPVGEYIKGNTKMRKLSIYDVDGLRGMTWHPGGRKWAEPSVEGRRTKQTTGAGVWELERKCDFQVKVLQVVNVNYGVNI